MMIDYAYTLMIYLAGAAGGVGFGYILGRGFLGQPPTGSGFPVSTPPPMPRGCIPPVKNPLPVPKAESWPVIIRFTPGSPVEVSTMIEFLKKVKNRTVYFEKRSFPEGESSSKFGLDKIPKQYNG